MNSFHKDNLEALQKFQQMLNAKPDELGIEKTPDGKAKTLVVSALRISSGSVWLTRSWVALTL